MAAVQRTPTPVDIRSRKAFIESMEEELKKVQDHLDRRQWKNRNGSTSALEPILKSPVQTRQWYTLARSNPATRKRHANEKEAESISFTRVSSAQDKVMRTGSTVDSCSSTSSKSPTPEPIDVIRVKSPSLPLISNNMPQLTNFSSTTADNHSQDLLSPTHHHSMHSPPSYLYPSSLPPQSSSKLFPSFNETPLLVKEMPFGVVQPRLPISNSMHSDDDEEDDDTNKEVMPSAFGDLYLEESREPTQQLSQHHVGGDAHHDEENEEGDNRNSRSVDNLMHHITPPLATVSLNRKEEDDEGIGKSSLTILESSKFIDDTTGTNSAYEYQRYQRIQNREEDKARTEMLQLIDDLKEQLREKNNNMMLMQERLHVEVKVREERIKKLMRQHAKSEKEKWDLLKKAREAAERSVNMRTKLDLNDNQLRSTIVELERVNDELFSVKAANKSLRLMVSDLKNKDTLVDSETQTEQCAISVSSCDMFSSDAETQTVNGEGGSGLGDSMRTPDYEDWEDMLSITSSQYDSRDVTPINTPKLERGKGRRSMKKLLNRFRRTGSAGKQHSTSSLIKSTVEAATSLDNLRLSQSSLVSPLNLSRSSGSVSVSSCNNRLSIVSLHEAPDPNQVLDEFKTISFNQWNTRALVAWMEVVVGMPHYISNVRQYVTSGHAMLALSNSDLEKRLGISNPLHRRRLRLAIEEYRTMLPGSSHSHLSDIDHNWIAYTWAIECGLPHISASLYNGMVNGNVLNSFSKDDLKKYLKIGKKIEQLSFLSGVELLRMHDFDREAIKSHRQSSKNPLYWTNTDVCEWLRNTDLEAFADNITASGVHGALLFLERGNFTSEHLANIIHIPPKSALRRILANQLAKLFSTEEITSMGEEAVIEEQPLTNQSPSQNSISPTGENSPHPMRRLAMGGGLSYATSNPDVSEGDEASFSRHSRERTSLRESMLRSVTNPPPRMVRPLSQRPVSQVCSTTTV